MLHRCTEPERKRRVGRGNVSWFSIFDYSSVLHLCRKRICDLLVGFINATRQRTNPEFDRATKAALVKNSAFSLMEEIRTLESDELVNYYLHCAYFHLPDQILRCPIDVNDASGASIEHIHQPVKRAFMFVNQLFIH